MKGNDGVKGPAIELRPRPVLAIGISGHRSIAVGDPAARVVAEALAEIFHRLSRAFNITMAREAEFFSGDKPTLRVVSMAAQGADLLCVQAGQSVGAETACILPFAPSEYWNDFSSPGALELAQEIIACAATLFVLPGDRNEGPRAYERANDAILLNSDLLIAVWDGQRANGRAGTGDVVQSAVSRGIPVIVVDPQAPGAPTSLASAGDDQLAHPIATDLPRKRLDQDLAALVASVSSPPAGTRRRRGLVDLFGERTHPRSFRVEYPLLLKIFLVSRMRRNDDTTPRIAGADPWLDTSASALDRRRAELRDTTRVLDEFATHYGGLYRSSGTSEYLLLIMVGFLSGILAAVFPHLFVASTVAQVVVTSLVLIDAAIRSRRRWQERWLDYRSIAERLRSLRFLHPLGLAPPELPAAIRQARESWVDWYVRRRARGLGAPTGLMDHAEITSAARRLAEIEIPEQVNYHRNTFRQLGVLDRRLSIAGNVALGLAIAVAAMLGIWAYVGGGMATVGWKSIGIALLFVLPAVMMACNGIRANADLVRLVERSAMAAVILTRLRSAICSSAPTYDRVAVGAMRAASVMADELSEWRFVLESRRVRRKGFHMLRRPRFRR